MVTTNARSPAPKAPSRFLKLGLSLRVSLVLFLVVVLLVLGSIWAVRSIGQETADRRLEEVLEKSHSVHSGFQQRRFEQLSLVAEAFTSNSAITAFIAEAAERRDRASILDQLYERQEELGFDFAIVLDPGGRVLARTDSPDTSGENLSERSLVVKVQADNDAFGIWRQGDELFNAVAVPLVQDFDLFGYLITGYSLDDDFARQVRNAASSEIAFLLPDGDGKVVASTLSAVSASDLLANLRSLGPLDATLASSEKRRVELEGQSWVAVAAPLRDAGEGRVGAAVTLSSEESELSPYRRLIRGLALLGAGALALGTALAWLLSKSTLRPMDRLLQSVRAARSGDYSQEVGLERADEVGDLASSLDGLLADLREKREVESVVAAVARSLPEPSLPMTSEEATTREVVLLALENRSLSNPNATRDPMGTVERLTKDIRRITSIVRASGGRVESMMGNRFFITFDQAHGAERGAERAIGAAGQIMSQLSRAESAFEEVEPPVLALVRGEVVVGRVVVGQQPEQAMAGVTVRQLESLLREGNSGDIVLSREVYEQTRARLERAEVKVAAQRGLLSPQPLFILDQEKALKLALFETSGSLPVVDSDGRVAGADSLAVPDIGPGSLLGGRYEVLSILDAEKTGVVYKALDRELDDFVALKILSELAASDWEEIESATREARKVVHESVARTYESGTFSGQSFVAFEYVRGLNLRALLDYSGRLPPAAGMRLAKQLSSALEAIHEKGLVHGGVRPRNLVVEPAGQAKLMQLGLQTGAQERADLSVLPYLAPERLRGEEANPASDLYEAGILLYELFLGRRPFACGSAEERQSAQLDEPPPAPSTLWPGIAPALEKLLLRLLEKNPSRRVSSSAELRVLLDSVSL